MSIKRIVLTGFLAIGVALIAAPLSMSMFSRSSNGEKMVSSFRPIMQPVHVAKTAEYYNGTFVALRPFARAMPGVAQDAQKLVPALAQALHMTPAQVQHMLATQFPSIAKLLQSMPQALPVFSRVPAGLDFYKSLVQTMQANVTNYQSVDAMPRMSLFPLFFIIPGILLVLAGAYLLVGDVRPDLVWPKLGPRPTPVPH